MGRSLSQTIARRASGEMIFIHEEHKATRSRLNLLKRACYSINFNFGIGDILCLFVFFVDEDSVFKGR